MKPSKLQAVVRGTLFSYVLTALLLTALAFLLDGNSNARIYRIRWRFCCLYVSYSSIFIPIQHFSRLI